MEFVDISVKPDNEPAQTSLIESWSTLRAMRSGSRMIIESSPVDSSKSNGIVERGLFGDPRRHGMRHINHLPRCLHRAAHCCVSSSRCRE